MVGRFGGVFSTTTPESAEDLRRGGGQLFRGVRLPADRAVKAKVLPGPGSLWT